jgi:hypothetical protein
MHLGVAELIQDTSIHVEEDGEERSCFMSLLNATFAARDAEIVHTEGTLEYYADEDEEECSTKREKRIIRTRSIRRTMSRESINGSGRFQYHYR